MGNTPLHPSDICEEIDTSRSDFYVYLNFRKTTGEIFYVGKGCKDRAREASKKRRTAHWASVARKHGVRTQVLNGFQEWYAHELECDLIALHGRGDLRLGPLINKTDGGQGMAGWVPSEKTRAKHKAAMQRQAQDPEWRAKHKAAMQRQAQDPEWRAKTKAATQKSHSRPVLMCSTLQLFPSTPSAAEWLRGNGRSTAAASNIRSAALGLGKMKTAYGSRWIYIDDLV